MYYVLPHINTKKCRGRGRYLLDLKWGEEVQIDP